MVFEYNIVNEYYIIIIYIMCNVYELTKKN